jgi:hypothetical protein
MNQMIDSVGQLPVLDYSLDFTVKKSIVKPFSVKSSD